MTERATTWQGRLRWFAAEFLIVVTGILVALALNAWFQGRQDEERATNYLKRIDRDLDLMIRDANFAAAYERRQTADGLYAYSVLSHVSTADERQRASLALAHLLVRRTLPVHDGTYRDLISTGDMRLVSDQLRDELVDYYDEADRIVGVITKNNQVLVDELFVGTMLGRGLIMPLQNAATLPPLGALEDSLSSKLRGGYADQPGRLWTLPSDSPDLAAARAVLLQRIRAALLAENYMAGMLTSARHLKHEIQQALQS